MADLEEDETGMAIEQLDSAQTATNDARTATGGN